MKANIRLFSDDSPSSHKLFSCFGALLVLLAATGAVQAQMQLIPGIATIAGNGTAGYIGDGGAAGSSQLNGPTRIASDPAGNLYIADTGNNVVRRVDFVTGVIATVAGNGTAGYSGDGGAATSAELHTPNGVAVDAAGNLFIVDENNAVIRKVAAATGVITTVAGNGTPGFAGDGGPAISAELNQPDYVALDAAGNLYIAEGLNDRVRVVNGSTGIITTVAGNGTQGYAGDGGAATSAELYNPTAIVVNAAGYIYIADSGNSRVRKVNTGGIITTVAGNGTSGYTGDGGSALAAEISYPSGLALDNSGNLYIADSRNNVVREVNIGSGIIATVAGNGTAGFIGDNGPGPLAELHDASDVSINSNGNLYIADTTNSVIRKVTLNEGFAATSSGGGGATQNFFLEVTGNETLTSITVPPSQGGAQEFTVGAITGCTVNGSTTNNSGTICTVPVTFNPAYPGARNVPLQAVTGGGNINFGLSGEGTAPLLAITPGVLGTVAGDGTAGYTGDGAAATSAELNAPNRAVVDGAGNLYIADVSANVVRKVIATTGFISTVAGTGVSGYTGNNGAATSAKLNAPNGLGIDGAGNIYIADNGNCVIRKVTVATGVIATVAGNGTCGYTGDGAAAIGAELNTPSSDIAFDSGGNFYFADVLNNVIRKVSLSTGIITTVAGTGNAGYNGDGAVATAAELTHPDGVAFDNNGNLYIADYGNHVVREVNAATGIITTVAGNGTGGYAGDGALATSAELSSPGGVAVDAAGDVYIADAGSNVIRKVSAAGTITTVAGTATSGYSGDGGAATSGKLNGPADVALDGLGNLYIADTGSSVIREVNVGQSKWTASSTAYGATSTQNITVANIGNAPATIPPPNSGSNPATTGAFSVGGGSTCAVLTASSSAQTLAAGAACSYALSFSPTGVGAASGTVTLTDNSLGVNGSTQTISASGTGVSAGTAATLSAAHNPSQYGQTAVTATVVTTVGAATPAGTVQFKADGNPVGSAVTLNGSGTATFTFSALSLGSHTLSAVYTPGSSDFTGSTAAGISNTVSAATLTAAVAGNPTKVYDGTNTATLTGANYSLTGFAGSDGATVTKSAGTYAAANAGPQTVSVTLGTSDYTATGSTNLSNYALPTAASGPGTISGAPLAVSASDATRLYGTPNPRFSGSVTGQINGDTFTESFSTAATSASAAGTYAIVPSVTGTNAANYAVTATNGTLTVSKAGSGTTLSVSSASVHPGQSVTLTATVASNTTGTPTASVQFFDGSTALGSGTLSGGVATYSGTLSAGATHAITATYGGDANFTGSSSTAQNVAVAAQDFTFGLATGAGASQSVNPGGTATYQLVAAPLYTAFPGAVSFTLTGLPAGATYSFSPSSIASSGASTNATLTVTTSASAKSSGMDSGPKTAPLLVAFIFLPLAGFRKMRRMGVRFTRSLAITTALLLSLAGMLGMNACGSSSHGNSTQSAAQTYSLTATATSGGTSHAATLTLTVQ
jgi:sugar lactone lactonase YvrE